MDPSAAELQSALNLARILMALCGILPFVGIAISIYAARRNPSITEEMYRDFASKAEMTALREHFDKTMTEFFTRQHLDQSAIDDKFHAIMIRLGELKGEFSKCPYMCVGKTQ